MNICVIGFTQTALAIIELLYKCEDHKVKSIEHPCKLNEKQDMLIVCCELSTENVDTINEICDDDCLLVIETRSPQIGTIKQLFGTKKVAYSPGRFDAGRMDWEPEEIPKLVGGISQEVEERVLLVYDQFFQSLIGTNSIEAAEAAKLYEDYHRLVNIAFANEFGDLCYKNNLDPYLVMDLAYTKPFGFEGPYFPWVGVRNISYPKSDNEDELDILSTCTRWLYFRPRETFNKIVDRFCKGDHDKIHEKRFLVVGIGYKAFSHITEGSPIIDIINFLRWEGAKVDIYDLFVKKFSNLPDLHHNSGRDVYDGIIVFHPYSLSQWSNFKNVLYFCKH